MGKGYAEGSAVEERIAALERGGDDLHAQLDAGRAAVYGATDGNAEPHFLGWLDEVDPDELVRVRRGLGPAGRPPPHDYLATALPRLEHRLDVVSLGVGEGDAGDDASCLFRVVVRDRRLEPFAVGRRLAQLPAEPAQQRDGGGARGHSRFSQIS